LAVSDVQKKSLLWGRVSIIGLYLSLLVFAIYLVISAILPAYTSPQSRLYSSAIGYPALLRTLGRDIPVDVSSVGYREIEKLISATGDIGYENHVPINIEIPGIVTGINVSLGERVIQGDVLVRLKSSGMVSQVADLDVGLKERLKDKAEADFLREKKAFEQGLISQTDLDQYEIAYNQALVSYEKAKVSYENSELTRRKKIHDGDEPSATAQTVRSGNSEIDVLTPVSGIVTERNIEVGENLLGPRPKALSISNNLIFRAQFNQRYINEVKVGQIAEVYLRAYPGERFTAEIIGIDKLVTPVGHRNVSANLVPFVFNARLKLQSNISLPGDLVSGMNGYALLRERDRRLVIPESAMMRYSGQQGVVLVVDKSSNRLQARKVTFDVADMGWIGIESGLELGDIVVKSGQIALQEGDAVVLKGSNDIVQTASTEPHGKSAL